MADCQEELLFQHLCHRESGESAASVGTTVTAEADVTAEATETAEAGEAAVTTGIAEAVGTAEAAGTAWPVVLINTVLVA